MNGLFVFLFLLSIVLLSVVVVKPNILEKITKLKFTRLKAGLLLGGISLVCFMLIGLTKEPKVKSNSEQEAETITSKPIFTPTTVPQTQKLPTSTSKPTMTPRLDGQRETKILQEQKAKAESLTRAAVSLITEDKELFSKVV